MPNTIILASHNNHFIYIYFHTVRLSTTRFKMVGFLGVSDELIVLILAHIRKPSHILQLALVNKRVLGIAIHTSMRTSHSTVTTITH